jgi:hypothetical protein
MGMSYVQAMRSYEAKVRQVMFMLGSGTFRLEIDEAAPSHMISHNTIVNVILSELNHVDEPQIQDLTSIYYLILD